MSGVLTARGLQPVPPGDRLDTSDPLVTRRHIVQYYPHDKHSPGRPLNEDAEIDGLTQDHVLRGYFLVFLKCCLNHHRSKHAVKFTSGGPGSHGHALAGHVARRQPQIL